MQQRMAQIIPSSYKPDLAAALLSPQESICFFGTDGFTDTILTYEMGFGCYDSFGGFGFDPYSAGGYDSFDPFFGFDPVAGETCDQCKERQRQICGKEKDACNARIFQGGFWASAGCVGVGALTGGGTLLLCIGLIFGGAGSGGVACSKDYDACLLKVVDQCPQCR